MPLSIKRVLVDLIFDSTSTSSSFTTLFPLTFPDALSHLEGSIAQLVAKSDFILSTRTRQYIFHFSYHLALFVEKSKLKMNRSAYPKNYICEAKYEKK